MFKNLADRTINKWFAARRLRRRFREVNQFAIGALPEDTFGRLSGSARPFDDNAMQAPLSGRACVYWVIEVIDDHGLDWPIGVSGMASMLTPKTTLVHDARGVPFVLEEEGHCAIVDPTSAQISLVFDHTSKSKAAFDANEHQRAVLETHDLVQRNWFNTTGLVYREAIIEVGERIWLLGSGTREPDPDPRAASDGAYRSNTATRLRLTSSAQHPLCITDDPRCM
jgi:hypothetical protein